MTDLEHLVASIDALASRYPRQIVIEWEPPCDDDSRGRWLYQIGTTGPSGQAAEFSWLLRRLVDAAGWPT